MERHAYFDNAKLVLIFLVVFGHVIQPGIEALGSISVIYTWIYIFHMPAFIFLAGFFAKGSGESGYLLKLAKKLLLPYFVFQLIYTGYFFLLGKEEWSTTPFEPHWSLWFLLSLFFWHVLLAVFKRMPAVIGVGIAVAAGVLAGYTDQIGHAFSISRTIVLFPFFLLGFWVKTEHVYQLQTVRIRRMAVCILSAFLLAIILLPDFSHDWLKHANSYAGMEEPVYGGLIRLGVYLAAALMTVSFLALISRKENVFSKLGQRTLYVYLLHGFFIQFFREADLFGINHPIDVIGLAAISLLITLMLSSKPVLRLWQPLIEGKLLSWLPFRRHNTNHH